MNNLVSQKIDVDTFGQTKFNLIRKGVFVPREVKDTPEVCQGMCDGVPGEELVLALAENFIAKVPMKARPEDSLRIHVDANGVFLENGDRTTEVGVIALPRFVREYMQERSPIFDNCCLDGYCLNIFLRWMTEREQFNLSQDTILKVIESAFQEGVADLVQINLDYCDEPDRGFTRVAPIVQEIKKKFSTFVALKGFPPQDPRMLDKIYASGVDLLNLPLEGFAGSAESEQIISPKQVQKALEYATGIFAPGTVWTELFLKPGFVDPVKNKISQLTGKGVIPLLKLQPPSIVTGDEPASLKEVAVHLEECAQKNKLPLKWLYPNCRYMTPLDTRYYTHPPQTARLNAKPVYKSRLGKRASEGFAALRRKLRIKDISDSYESAGL